MIAGRIMRRVALTLVVLGALVGGWAVPAQAAAPPGFIGVQGTVVEDGTGAPLTGVEVRIGDRSGTLTLTDADGWFGFGTGVNDGDSYDLYIEGDATHVGAVATVTYSIAGGTGDVGLIPLSTATMISGRVTVDDGGAAVPAAPIAGITVVALPVAGGLPATDVLGETGATGEYRIAAPAGAYNLLAFESAGLLSYDPEIFDDLSFILALSGCACVTPDEVTSPATGVDFSLRAYDDWAWFATRMLRTDGTDYPNVSVRLDKLLTGGWQQVDVAVTDADGYADLFGFGDGTYRLRYYSSTGARLVGTAFDDFGYGGMSFANARKSLEMAGVLTAAGGGSACGCRVVPFAGPDVDVTLAGPSSGTGGAGGTPTPPAPRVDRFDPAPASLPITTPTPTPVATPSSTPSPTPSPQPTGEPEPSPTTSPTPDPVPVSDAGFPWWIVLIALLVLGIIVTVIVVVRRRT